MNRRHSIPSNILIVDDEQDLCFLLSQVLAQKQFHSRCVYSIADAKKSLEKMDPTVMFLDNCLPDGNGLDYIAEVKREHPSTKIVMITAHNSIQEMDLAFSKGADYFISKPFSAGVIMQTMDLLTPQE